MCNHLTNGLVLVEKKMNFSKEVLRKILMKYRQLVGRIILLSYLLIFTLNLFHFHKYDINCVSVIDISNESNRHIQVSKSEIECIVHQNLLSLQTALTNFLANNLLLNPDPSFCSFDESKNKFCSLHLSDNFLRAPPDQSIKN